MKADIYKAIEKALEGSDLKHVDLNKGQLKRPKNTFPFPLPAGFVSFPNSPAEHTAGTEIEQDIAIEVVLILDELNSSFRGSVTQDKNLDRFELQEDIINRLVFIKGECFSELLYTGDDEEFTPNSTEITLGFSTIHNTKLRPYVSRI